MGQGPGWFLYCLVLFWVVLLTMSEQSTIEYWQKFTVNAIRKHPEYKNLPPYFDKGGLAKAKLCLTLASWCANNGPCYEIGTYGSWNALPIWILKLTTQYQRIPTNFEGNAKSRLSKSQICRALVYYHNHVHLQPPQRSLIEVFLSFFRVTPYPTELQQALLPKSGRASGLNETLLVGAKNHTPRK